MQVAYKFGSREVLDYGCGKQFLKEAIEQYGYKVTGYDPAIDGLEATPEPHDIVYCGDVLEHIEPELLDGVLEDLRRVTKLAAILVVNSDPAGKKLPDG